MSSQGDNSSISMICRACGNVISFESALKCQVLARVRSITILVHASKECTCDSTRCDLHVILGHPVASCKNDEATLKACIVLILLASRFKTLVNNSIH